MSGIVGWFVRVESDTPFLIPHDSSVSYDTIKNCHIYITFDTKCQQWGQLPSFRVNHCTLSTFRWGIGTLWHWAWHCPVVVSSMSARDWLEFALGMISEDFVAAFHMIVNPIWTTLPPASSTTGLHCLRNSVKTTGSPIQTATTRLFVNRSSWTWTHLHHRHYSFQRNKFNCGCRGNDTTAILFRGTIL